MTRYVIRRLSDGAWWGSIDWTTDPLARQTFDFMSSATYYALSTLGLGGYEFVIDPI